MKFKRVPDMLFMWEAYLKPTGEDYPEYVELIQWHSSINIGTIVVNLLVEALHHATFDGGVLSYDGTTDAGTRYKVRVVAVLPEDQALFKLRWC